MAKNQHAKRKIISFKNWYTTESRKIRLNFRKWSFSFLRKIKQIFFETCRSIEDLITKIYFEVEVYNFEAIMAMGSAQVALSSNTYSYINFQSKMISCYLAHIGPRNLQFLAPLGTSVFTHLTLGGGGGLMCPQRNNGRWGNQFSFYINSQDLIWKLWSLPFIWYSGMVAEAVSLASGGHQTDQWQKEKNHRWKFGIRQFLS